MATLIKHNSLTDIMPTNVIAAIAEPKHSNKDGTPTTYDSLAQLDKLIVAWGQGRFNTPDTVDAAVEEFFHKDLVFDAASANSHADVAEFKEYTFDTVKDWFTFVGSFDIADMELAVAKSSSDASQVWQRCSATTTSKATGRSLLVENLNIIDFEGGKIRRMTAIYADPTHFAYLNGTSETLPTMVKPMAFEPHPDPKLACEAVIAAWGSGEFGKDDTKQATFDKLIHAKAVTDVSSAVLPDVFKVYRGHAGTDEWTNKVVGKWEFTRVEITPEAGLKPGCAMQKLDFDAKHQGNEAKGLLVFNEQSYDTDGKIVHQKVFWANPRVAASLYKTGR